MKKISFFALFSFIITLSFAQGSVETGGFVSAGSTNPGLDYTLGQTFHQSAPSGSVPLVVEGLLHGFTTVDYDTLLLYNSEMASYTPGENTILGLSPEGYDQELHRQVYQLTCTPDYEHTMTVSGVPTYSVTHPEPDVQPADGLVTLSLDRANPYDYPVGETTPVTWTASVAGQSKNCTPNVIIHFFDCSTVTSPADYNSYPVVQMGRYCWTGTNMKAENYMDGSVVNNILTYPLQNGLGITDMAATFGYLYPWEMLLIITYQPLGCRASAQMAGTSRMRTRRYTCCPPLIRWI